jgi:hypothetical protein
MEAYCNKSYPQIGWDDGSANINHFELIRYIYCNYPIYRKSLEKFKNPDAVSACGRVVENEFSRLMSDIRRNAICTCLQTRHEWYRDAAS